MISLKQKFNTFIDNNRDISLGIDRYYNFIQKYGISVHKSLEDYKLNKTSLKRKYLVSLSRIMTMLTSVRYLSSALISKKWMIIVMSDANHLLGNQKFFSFALSIASFVVLCMGAVIQFKEMTQRCELWQFLYDFKHKRIIPLNDKHDKRLTIFINLMTKYVMEQAFRPMVILFWGLIGMPPVIAYLDPESGFNLSLIFIWNSMALASCVQLFSLMWFGFVGSVVCTQYLKYKFNEINEEFESSLQINKKYLLKRAIAEHNFICGQTSQLNEYFCHFVFQLYYIASPALMICLYLSHANETPPLVRCLCAVAFTMVFSVVFFLNLLYSQINGSSRRPRNIVYRLMIRKQLPVEERIKLLAFIEKLDGPDIGFYCWNLCPMNHNQFYLYVANCASTYFLILDLV